MKHDCDPIYQAWYMRDNHTFVKLPPDTESAMEVLRQEICIKRYGYGMLCATPHAIRPQSIHASGPERWVEFERAARTWFIDFNRIAANFEAAAP